MKVDLEFLKKCAANNKRIMQLLEENNDLEKSASNNDAFDAAWIVFKFGNGVINYNFVYQTNLKNITPSEKKKRELINNFIKKWKKINIEEINQLKEV